jgi:Sulfotransferase family
MAASMHDPSPAAQQRPRVVYVMGAGRSGSTVFGVTLGNCEGVFYAGELDAWLARAGEPQLGGVERERFWNGVREEVPGAAELFGREAQRAIERTASLVRVHMWASRRRLRVPYRRVSVDLYRALSRATGGKVIVDTSHYPLRAHELQRSDEVDFHLVYLVRDPRSVVASFNRKDIAQYSKSPLTTNVYLWFTNLLCVLAFARQPRERRLFVRYEDFVADPLGVLRSVLEPLGVHDSSPDLSSLRTGIPFQGNRLIKSDVIALESAGETRAPSSPLTALAQLPWTVVLSRLRPAATPSAGRAYAIAD